MAKPFSFQDQLAKLPAEREQIDRQADGRAAYERMLDYQLGIAIAKNIIGRAISFGSTFERTTATLRMAANSQPDTLTGRVAASELADAVKRNESWTPDTEAERRRLTKIARMKAAAAARREHNFTMYGYGLDKEYDR